MPGHEVVALVHRLRQCEQQPFGLVDGKSAVVRRIQLGLAFPLRSQQVAPGFLGTNHNRLTQRPHFPV